MEVEASPRLVCDFGVLVADLAAKRFDVYIWNWRCCLAHGLLPPKRMRPSVPTDLDAQEHEVTGQRPTFPTAAEYSVIFIGRPGQYLSPRTHITSENMPQPKDNPLRDLDVDVALRTILEGTSS